MFKKIILEYVKEGILEIKNAERFEEELKQSDLNNSIIVTKDNLIEHVDKNLSILKYSNGETSYLELENLEDGYTIASIEIE